MTRVNRSVGGDISLRLQNLQLVVNSILHFYLNSQQQLVLAPLPDVDTIAHKPESEKSLDELERLIILLLGCAIQCDHKTNLVEQMKNMEVEQQQGLIFYIQKITETTEFVCSLDWEPDDMAGIARMELEGLCRQAYLYLQQVAKDRDGLFDNLIDTVQERDFYKDQPGQLSVSSVKASPSPQVNPELIELKKQARAYQEDIDQKTDMITEMSQSLEQAKAAIQKLHSEKLELLDDAKSARALRDELEAFKVQSAKMEKLETDVTKYRQKAEDVEYLKKRVLELKQQNELMIETKTLLEQKVTSLTSKADTVDDLQVEIASYKVQLDALNQEKQMDMERIEELVAQTARLDLENKSNQEQIQQLLSELETERERMSAAGVVSGGSSESSLGFEMSEADLAQRAKLNRLEKETREMEKNMEALRHAQAKVAELEKTNKKLYTQNHSDRKDIIKLREELEMLKVKASRVDKLQAELTAQREKVEEGSRMQSRLKELKSRNEQILEAKAMLEDEVDNLQNKVTLLETLKSESAQLKVQIDTLNTEHIEDQARVQELMEQNAQLELEKQKCSEKIDLLTAELSKGGGGVGGAKMTVLTPSRVSETDMAAKAKLQRLEKEAKEMEKTMESLRHSQAKVTELEKKNKRLQEQSHLDKKELVKLKEELQSYKSKTSRLERKQSSVKMNENDKTQEVEAAHGKIAELKQQNLLLTEAKILMEEEINSYQAKLDRIGDMQGENAALKVRVSSLEEERQDDEQRMQSLMTENAQLEMERDRNRNDIESMKTELDKLRLSLSVASSSVKKEENSGSNSPVRQLLSENELANRAKLLRLERDHRDLQRTYELYKQRTERAAAEIEKNNKKLNTQLHTERKEVVKLKEELKHEKDVASTLTKQVERLQKSAANPSDPVTDGREQKKISDLSTKFDEALSQSLSIKEGRINQLEGRLTEVIRENESLRNEMSSLKRRSPLSPTHQPNTSTTPVHSVKEQEVLRLREKNAQLAASFNDSKHIMKHQQHKLDTLQERQEMLEQLNQTLEEEKKTLLMQVNKLLEQNQSLLYKTLETKDHELEEERIFSDKLGELEKEKNKLSEQLIHQQKQTMAMEMDMLRKREKSKNLLKKGLKKLKNKFQNNSYKIPEIEGVEPASSTSYSPRHTINFPPSYLARGGDGSSLSSNQSISSNSHHSGGSNENLDPMGSAPDVNQYVPRGPFLNTPVTLRQRKTQSLIVPSSTDVLPSSLSSVSYLPGGMRDKSSPDVMSLEEFLAETVKTPNRRKLMELKRASIATPPATPRGSMLFGMNNLGPGASNPHFDQADITDFLKTLQGTDDTLSIPEVDEDDKHSYTSSGSTTQEESYDKMLLSNLNTNNNNNNNNNVFVSTVSRDPGTVPTSSAHSFVPKVSSVATSSYSFRPISTQPFVPTSQPVSSRPLPAPPSHRQSNEPEKEDIILTQPLSSGGSETSQTTPSRTTHNLSSLPRRGSIERKRFYNSLADLNSKKQSEKRKTHKSTENLLEEVEDEGAVASKNRSRLHSADSPVAGDNKKTRRKLFSSWRRNSSSTTPPCDSDHAHVEGAVVYV
ncbi:PREDICTED: girdin-like [Amphimedon queenslandica]|nr:PREDICTED: girdin-like [Amphimedon queenslandica]|eukprot:XP_019849313.1 PREDICTED: girdin-like [Amphimedon queenslandica]